MPTITDQAVVIRQWDFSETSQTVSLFTRNHGIIRGLAKGSRREKGNFSGGLDVLTGGQLVAIVKPGRDLATLTAWHVQQMYPAVRRDLAANRIGLYLADLIHHMIIAHDPHPIVFDALAATLEGLLNTSPQLRGIALLQFQWRLLQEAGYEPQIHLDARTGHDLPANATSYTFSAQHGGLINELGPRTAAEGQVDSSTRIVAIDPYNKPLSTKIAASPAQKPPISRDSHPIAHKTWKVRRDTVEILRNLADLSPNEAKSDSITRANRLLAAYFREIIGSEPPAMRWAFPNLLESSPDKP